MYFASWVGRVFVERERMRIDSYRFGGIVIGGKVYNHDVTLVDEKVKCWVRKGSHWLETQNSKVKAAAQN